MLQYVVLSRHSLYKIELTAAIALTAGIFSIVFMSLLSLSPIPAEDYLAWQRENQQTNAGQVAGESTLPRVMIENKLVGNTLAYESKISTDNFWLKVSTTSDNGNLDASLLKFSNQASTRASYQVKLTPVAGKADWNYSLVASGLGALKGDGSSFTLELPGNSTTELRLVGNPNHNLGGLIADFALELQGSSLNLLP